MRLMSAVILLCYRCVYAQTTPGTEFGVGPCGDPTGETPFAIASALQDAMLVTDRAAGVVRVFGGAPADAPRMVRAPVSSVHDIFLCVRPCLRNVARALRCHGDLLGRCSTT